MTKLVIESWSDNNRWVSDNSWNHEAFCNRIAVCTNLKGTELKRTARKIMNKELKELNINNKEKAEPLIHALESLGAKIVFE